MYISGATGGRTTKRIEFSNVSVDSSGVLRMEYIADRRLSSVKLSAPDENILISMNEGRDWMRLQRNADLGVEVGPVDAWDSVLIDVIVNVIDREKNSASIVIKETP